jgi:predicted permease
MKRTFRITDSVPDPSRDVSDELRFHLEMRTKEFVDQGLSPEAARAAAIASFGDLGAITAECREVRVDRDRERGWRDWGRGLRLDLTHALRTLRQNRSFSLAAVLTIGLGMGAAAAVFTVVDGVLLRPLPYANPDRLAMVWLSGSDVRGSTSDLPLSSGFFVALRDRMRTAESIAAFRSWSYNLGDVSEPELVAGVRATSRLFSVLGVRPFLGRTFTEAEAVPGSPNVALISYGLWQRRFGKSTSIVGKPITLSGKPYLVLGVMPPGFGFPRGAELPSGLQFRAHTDVWTPLVFSPDDLSNYGTLNLAGIARIRSGVSLAQANQDGGGVISRLLKELGSPLPLGLQVVRLQEQASGKVRRGLLILMGAVGLVLLVACANVINLLLARTAARRREFAVRAALGAGRARIARQLVTENLLLCVGGAAIGIGVATLGTRAMLALVPGSLPRAADVALDWAVVGTTFAAALVIATVFGVISGWDASRFEMAATLQSAGARTTAGKQRRIGRRMLVGAEVALSLMLLIGAALLGGSFARLQRVSPGFVPDHALTADILVPINEPFNVRRDGPGWSRFFTQLVDRLQTVPGVRAAGAVSSLPLSGAVESGQFSIEGQPPPPAGQGPGAEYAVVSGDYFKAMGIRLLAGRGFDSRDAADGAPVIIVNRELARRYFPNGNAIGKRIAPTFDFSNGVMREIIGIVDDVKQTSLDGETVPAAYETVTQMPYPFMSIVVRTTGDPLSALPAIRHEVAALDASLALARVRTLGDVFDESLARQRFNMIVLGAFAGAALALALVGLYGVIAYSVGQRQREIGVRVALGARRGDILRLVLGEGFRVTAVGVVAGLLGAIAVTRVLGTLLFGVSTMNLLAYAGATIVVVVVSVAATYGPARRATRVAPTHALRGD